jgi:hypothetical protein
MESASGAADVATTDPRMSEEARVPTWVWVVLGTLAAAMVVVIVGLARDARHASTNATAARASATQLMNGLVASVATTNQELKTFNEQLESASSSAQKKASSAQQQKSQHQSSSPQSP